MAQIDKLSIDLIALLISGISIFAILTGYSVPQLHSTFWEKNPHGIKKDAIESVSSWIFVIIASIGFILQMASMIYEDVIPDRIYSRMTYIFLSIFGTLTMLLIVWIGGKLSRYIAKKKWLPEVVDLYRESYRRCLEKIQNEGLINFEINSDRSEEQTIQLKEGHLKSAIKTLRTIEDVFETTSSSKDLQKRINHLNKYFFP